MATPRNARPGMLLDPSASINNGLVGWWPMWEGAGGKTLDISGKGNHGVLTNGPVWGGGGLNFDATDDYISCGNSSILKPVLPISVFARFTLIAIPTTYGLFTNDDVTNYAGILIRVVSDGSVFLTFGDNTGVSSGNRRSKQSAAGIITAGKEYTVVGVIRGATDMSIYVNGVDVGGTYSGTGGTTMVYSTGNAVIGKDRAAYFNGGIKHLRMWNRGLSAAEAQRLSANPNIGLWTPDYARYYVAAAGGADVRNHIIPAYMRIAA